jgi:putative ABC transport system ATP-binding protein
MSILKLEDVGYRYKDADENDFILRNINYEFDKGKTYAIKGKSGSGKTTLLSLISGLEKCTEGEIYFKDQDLSKYDLDKYRSKDVGIIFQAYNLLPHLTASENIILSMDINHLKIKDKNKKANELLKNVGLSEKEGDRRVLKLSGGEQQRVAIARSLSYNPEIILADEPTGNLDKETEEDIMKIFKDLAHKENKCVIIVTHSKNIADSVDTVFELKKTTE